jgi:Type I site-specific restriction-modification system, R (restriction) subunit and related helicases
VHAALIRDLINQESDSKSTDYCKRVTAEDGAMGELALRDFQNDEKSVPTVLTTSQKLSTGVDAPEIRNIVLLRPVNSMVEFKQIVGRGTRLFDGKDYFTVFDFVKAHLHFQDPDWDGEPQKNLNHQLEAEYQDLVLFAEKHLVFVKGQNPILALYVEIYHAFVKHHQER